MMLFSSMKPYPVGRPGLHLIRTNAAGPRIRSYSPSIYTVHEDRYGNILNMSYKSRTAPETLARALNVRDETCQFPGCCETRYVDFHHIKHWANLGPTKYGNLIKLCHRHHRAIHDEHYCIEKQGDMNDPKFIFKTPTGKIIEPSPKLRHTDKTTTKATIEEFDKRWPIDSHTSVAPRADE